MANKVFVSGCFDLLHSGHVEFFRQAAELGDLYVALGSDKTVFDLKGRRPINSEGERRFMVESVASVHSAFISQGSGYLDFSEELKEIHPDVFVVNEDGNTLDKRNLCTALGIEYKVLRRQPHRGFEARSTTALRRLHSMPYRIDLAGGWLDQPYVSKHHPGSVITLSIEPTLDFNERSGMATSTRRTAIELWGSHLPSDRLEKTARILFCCDNPPGGKYVSGSQDSIGIVYPGLAKAYYDDSYWPERLEHIQQEEMLRFVENLLYLIPLGPRHSQYDVLSDTDITPQKAKALADAAEACWQGIIDQDSRAFGQAFRASFEAQIAMFPHMSNPQIEELIETYRDQALGWKLSGAGGGGYLILVADAPVEDALQCVVRRDME